MPPKTPRSKKATTANNTPAVEPVTTSPSRSRKAAASVIPSEEPVNVTSTRRRRTTKTGSATPSESDSETKSPSKSASPKSKKATKTKKAVVVTKKQQEEVSLTGLWVFTAVYALLLIAGGLYAYTQKGSEESLVYGSGSGLVVLATLVLDIFLDNEPEAPQWPHLVRVVTVGLVTGGMAGRGYETSKLFPSAPVVIGGILVILYDAYMTRQLK